MGSSRFVRPDTKTLQISDGDTLLVKKRLNAGEQRAAFGRMYLAGLDGTLKVNPLQTGMAQITAYLLDWSLKDEAGHLVVIRDQPIEVVTAALDALDPDDYAEIRQAIDRHEDAMQAERVQEKNGRGGVMESPAISPSPVAAAGATSGSLN